MLYLNHENIIKFYGYFEDKENINKFREINPGDPNIFNAVADLKSPPIVEKGCITFSIKWFINASIIFTPSDICVNASDKGATNTMTVNSHSIKINIKNFLCFFSDPSTW